MGLGGYERGSGDHWVMGVQTSNYQSFGGHLRNYKVWGGKTIIRAGLAGKQLSILTKQW